MDPPASPAASRFYYDYVDPASYLMDEVMSRIESRGGPPVRRGPFEIRLPPAPLVDASGTRWSRYLSEMAEAAAGLGVPFDPPPLVPWSRKAHELALHAREVGRFDEVHVLLYRAYFVQRLDIGRVDVLVRVGEEGGLDRNDAKVALDVDRLRPLLEEERGEARAAGIRGVPTLVAGGRTLEGFHPEREILTFLQRSADEDAGGAARKG